MPRSSQKEAALRAQPLAGSAGWHRPRWADFHNLWQVGSEESQQSRVTRAKCKIASAGVLRVRCGSGSDRWWRRDLWVWHGLRLEHREASRWGTRSAGMERKVHSAAHARRVDRVAHTQSNDPDTPRRRVKIENNGDSILQYCLVGTSYRTELRATVGVALYRLVRTVYRRVYGRDCRCTVVYTCACVSLTFAVLRQDTT
jgi:hypothetical protein